MHPIVDPTGDHAPMVKYERRGRSKNIEDRRGRSRGRRSRGAPAGFPVPTGGARRGGGIPRMGKLGIPGLILIAVLFFLGGGSSLLGGGGVAIDPGTSGLGQAPPGDPIPPELDPDAEQVEFVSFVLDDVQATWDAIFDGAGLQYQDAILVLYDGGTDTAGCGFGSAAAGPFYCPADSKVYIDLSFFDQLRTQFGAPGDFAQAYVIAHEIAHHVQNLLGVSDQVREEQRRNPDAANELNVALELQADCFAGIWGYSAFEADILESGDLEEGLRAAAAVGDDTIQKRAGTRVTPETWTHGSSAQRVEWFRRGFDTGNVDNCDPFG